MPTDLPLHPALVHLPLGVAFVVPLLALALTVAVWRGWLSRRVLWVLAGLQAVVLVSAFLAERTGGQVADLVEDAVPHSAIHEHAEEAETFTAAAGVLLVVFVAGAALPSARLGTGLAVAGTALSFLVAGLGAEAGHEGGKLVYQHGAAEAWNKATDGGKTGEGLSLFEDDDDSEDAEEEEADD